MHVDTGVVVRSMKDMWGASVCSPSLHQLMSTCSHAFHARIFPGGRHCFMMCKFLNLMRMYDK